MEARPCWGLLGFQPVFAQGGLQEWLTVDKRGEASIMESHPWLGIPIGSRASSRGAVCAELCKAAPQSQQPN